MKSRLAKPFFAYLFLFFVWIPSLAFADKASVSIEAPNKAAIGSEIIIQLTITHNANSYFHYVEWVLVKMNEKEINRWDYSSLKKPEGATFAKEIKITIQENIDIKAEANCNIHGSKGSITWKISLE